MYEELKKKLKELGLITEFCVEQRCFECKNKDLCDKYENKMLSDVYKNAARAIERLELEVAALKTDKDYLADENRKLVGAWLNAQGGKKWISVEEELPKDDTPVQVAYRNYNDKNQILSDMLACRYADIWCYWDGFPCSYDKVNVEITHWRPLQKPPKEGDNK